MSPLVVQIPTTGIAGLWTGTSFSAATTLASAVTAGNSLLVIVSHQNNGNNGATTVVTDNHSGSYSLLVRGTQPAGNSLRVIECWLLQSAIAASYTVTAVAQNGTVGQQQGSIIAYEVGPSKVDVVGSQGGNSQFPGTGLITPTLTNPTDLAFAIESTYQQSSAGITNPPTGGAWVSSYVNSSTNFGQVLYVSTLTTTTTTALQAAWGTLTTGNPWVTAIVTLQSPLLTAVPVGGLPQLEVHYR
jgi:hypothetical protein